MKKMKKLLFLLLALAMIMSLAACSGTANTGDGKTTMKAGTYTSTQKSVNGDLTVKVVLTDKAIDSVTVTDCLDTPGIGMPLNDASGKPLSNGGEAPTVLVPKKIVEAQSVNVDGVSGATLTSFAIKNAVSDCLTQAGAKLDDWKSAATPAQY